MNQSFSKVAELWKHEKRQYVKISSYSIYVHLLNKHILPVFGHGGAPEEHSVQGFANRMLSENYSIKTVKDALLVIKMIVRYGEKLGKRL